MFRTDFLDLGRGNIRWKVVLYVYQGRYVAYCCTLFPTTSSSRSLALGHSKVPKSSTRGWLEAWVLPTAILERVEDMSNSGGSWGPDGFLYLTGHDPTEAYRCKLPDAGSVIELVEIIPVNIRGQGIAWDRSEPGILYGIIRANSEERAQGIINKATVHRLIVEAAD